MLTFNVKLEIWIVRNYGGRALAGEEDFMVDDGRVCVSNTYGAIKDVMSDACICAFYAIDRLLFI